MKIYRALLSQLGSNDPTAIIAENSIGEIVWTRNGPGDYTGTLAGAFPVGKTHPYIGTVISNVENVTSVMFVSPNANEVRLMTREVEVSSSLSYPGDEMLNNTPVTILVYD